MHRAADGVDVAPAEERVPVSVLVRGLLQPEHLHKASLLQAVAVDVAEEAGVAVPLRMPRPLDFQTVP